MDTNDNTPNRNSAEEKEILADERALFEKHIIPIKYPSDPTEQGQGSNHIVFSHWYRTYASSTNKARSELRKNCQSTGFTTVDGGFLQMHTNGTVFDGFFQSNQFIEGRMIDSRGNFVEGKFKNNKIQGLGLMQLENQMTYDGEFNNGTIQGKGILNWISQDNSVVSFNGNFDNSRYFQGKCEIQSSDQTVKTIEGFFNVPFIHSVQELPNYITQKSELNNQIQSLQQTSFIVAEDLVNKVEIEQIPQVQCGITSNKTEIQTTSQEYALQQCSKCLGEIQPQFVEEPPMLIKEYVGLIIVNKNYDQESGKWGNVDFADNEISRIKSFFENFCKNVEVMKDVVDPELLEFKFAEIVDKSTNLQKVQKAKNVSLDQREGLCLLFHYLGHGATKNSSTHIILNAPESSFNPYPLECKLRSITAQTKLFVLGSLNCCRSPYLNQKVETLGNMYDYNNQIFLTFSANNLQSILANEKFGKRFVEELQKKVYNGILKLPRALELFRTGEKSHTMIRPVHLKILTIQEADNQLSDVKEVTEKISNLIKNTKKERLALEEKKKIQKQQKIAEETEKKRLEEQEIISRLAQEEENLKLELNAQQKLFIALTESLKKKIADQQKNAVEAENIRLAQEAEMKRLAQDTEKKRLALEAEKQRLAQEAQTHVKLPLFVVENYKLLRVREEFIKNPSLIANWQIPSYLASASEGQKQYVKEVLEIFYNDDEDDSLLDKYSDLKDFVTHQFKKNNIQGKSFQLPPNISALNDVFAIASVRYQFQFGDESILRMCMQFRSWGIFSADDFDQSD